MKKQQKYQTEIGLLQATRGEYLVRPSDICKLAKLSTAERGDLDRAHIYFVCQRPRVRLTSVDRVADSGFRFRLSVQARDRVFERVLEFPFPHPEIINIFADDSGTSCICTRSSGENGQPVPLEFLLPATPENIPELSELEALYIGQAYGVEGDRSAIDRLEGHATLQKVLADQAHSAWWMESMLLLFDFDTPRLVTKMDGIGTPSITEDADHHHFMSVFANPPSDRDLVSIAEASLIRFFQPPFNMHYSNQYPSTAVKHLKDAYRDDYNAIITEIDTADIYLKTFSHAQNAREHHIAQYDLHDSATRLSFFELPVRTHAKSSVDVASERDDYST